MRAHSAVADHVAACGAAPVAFSFTGGFPSIHAACEAFAGLALWERACSGFCEDGDDGLDVCRDVGCASD